MDVPELIRVINLAYLVEAEMFHGTRTTDDDLRDRLARPNAAILVVPDSGRDGAVAGSVYVETRGDHGYFGMLAVDPACQGRGLGRALVRAAEAQCRRLGCVAMDLDVVDVRRELTAFYGSLGYQAVGDSPFPHPEQTKRPVRLIHMTRALPDDPDRVGGSRSGVASIRSPPPQCHRTPARQAAGRRRSDNA